MYALKVEDFQTLACVKGQPEDVAGFGWGFDKHRAAESLRRIADEIESSEDVILQRVEVYGVAKNDDYAEHTLNIGFNRRVSKQPDVAAEDPSNAS